MRTAGKEREHTLGNPNKVYGVLLIPPTPSPIPSPLPPTSILHPVRGITANKKFKYASNLTRNVRNAWVLTSIHKRSLYFRPQWYQVTTRPLHKNIPTNLAGNVRAVRVLKLIPRRSLFFRTECCCTRATSTLVSTNPSKTLGKQMGHRNSNIKKRLYPAHKKNGSNRLNPLRIDAEQKRKGSLISVSAVPLPRKQTNLPDAAPKKQVSHRQKQTRESFTKKIQPAQESRWPLVVRAVGQRQVAPPLARVRAP